MGAHETSNPLLWLPNTVPGTSLLVFVETVSLHIDPIFFLKRVDCCWKGYATIMYLTIEQKALQTAVSAVQTIAGSGKTLMPILKHLLLVADATGIALSASNEETSIRYHLRADVQAAGTVLLPAHLFAGFVHDLPMAPISLVWPSPTDSTAVQVRCQQVKANIKQSAHPVEEFPQVPLVGHGCRELLKVDCELLREIIEQVAFASSEDPSRPILGGLQIVLEQGHARFGAADAFRLAVRTIAIPDQHLASEVIIPAQTLRNLARLLPPSGSVLMALSPGGNQVLFHTREMDLSARLMEGKFPAYRSLTETQAVTRVVLPTVALSEAVHLSSRFARANNHQLGLRICGSHSGEAASILLEAEAPDLGANEIVLTEAVIVDGPDLSLQINETYFADALAVLPTQQVVLEFTLGNRPIAIKPVGPLDSISIIMPLTFQTTTPAPVASGTTRWSALPMHNNDHYTL